MNTYSTFYPEKKFVNEIKIRTDFSDRLMNMVKFIMWGTHIYVPYQKVRLTTDEANSIRTPISSFLSKSCKHSIALSA